MPDKNKNKHAQPPGDEAPAPAGPRKLLHPLFGSRCVTQTYALRAYRRGHHHTRLEAVQDDPARKTWTVRKVIDVTEPGYSAVFNGDMTQKTHVHRLKSGLRFDDALDMLVAFEQSCTRRGNDFSVVAPDAAALGFAHYRAFAEREGYVFDVNGRPHARPHPDLLPEGASFVQADIESARHNLARPENEFDNNGPASKAPNTHFLFDQFTRATHNQGLHERFTQLRIMDILDHFTDQVKTAHDSLQEYCGHYRELGRGGLISDAEAALKMAGASLRQLRAYGVDTTAFDSFVLQCEITCHVLHAEGLYDLMNRQEGDFAQNERLFKERVGKALDAFRKIDDSDQGLKTLQDMIVQTPRPEVPQAMTLFLRNYETQREAWRRQNVPPASPPKNGGGPPPAP